MLPLAAAAFYNSSTGRWLNRDPSGEKGDINTYSFVANRPPFAFDALGLWGDTVDSPEQLQLMCDMTRHLPPDDQPSMDPLPKEKCAHAVDLMRHDKQIVAQLKKFKYWGGSCPTPNFECAECRICRGMFNPANNTFTICANQSDADLRTMFLHELGHALQDCGRDDYQDCRESLRRELDAYHAAGQCSDFSHCLAMAVGSSCSAPGHCPNGQEAADDFYWLEAQWNRDTVGPAANFARAPQAPAARSSSGCSTCGQR
jgi:hypothetical protein